MIWKWINAFVLFIFKLLIPPLPPPPAPEPINADAPCPFCGHCNGALTAVERSGEMMVQHQCQICRGKWWEQPVLKAYEPLAATGSTVKLEAPASPKE